MINLCKLQRTFNACLIFSILEIYSVLFYEFAIALHSHAFFFKNVFNFIVALKDSFLQCV